MQLSTNRKDTTLKEGLKVRKIKQVIHHKKIGDGIGKAFTLIEIEKLYSIIINSYHSHKNRIVWKNGPS